MTEQPKPRRTEVFEVLCWRCNREVELPASKRLFLCPICHIELWATFDHDENLIELALALDNYYRVQQRELSARITSVHSAARQPHRLNERKRYTRQERTFYE
jgi:hypothetical protein